MLHYQEMTTVLNIIAETLWYFLPALVANIAPVFAAAYNCLPSLATRLGRGLSWQGAPLIGNHKTVRGLVVALFFGSVTGFTQYLLTQAGWEPQRIFVSYSSPVFVVLWGTLLGGCSIIGDALKSFFKRRLGILPGTTWVPWDQVDMVIGVLLVTQWFAPLPPSHITAAFIVIGVGMLVTSALGIVIGIKKSL